MKEEEIYTQLFQFSRPTYFKWKREKVPIMELIAKYFDKEDLTEFLEKGFVSKYEKFDNYSLDPAFQDFVIHNLQRQYKLNRSFFNLFSSKSEFITRHLQSLSSEDLTDLTVKNAKEKFLTFISTVKLSKLFDSENKRNIVIKEINMNFSDIEIYLILKFPEKFIE